MNSRLSILILLIGLSVTSCRQEVIKLDPFQQNILESTIYTDNSHLQSLNEISKLKANRVKTMSIIQVDLENNIVDSLEYLEFDREGKLLQRTTKISYLNPNIMIRQIINYKNNRITSIDNYTFKFKTKSIKEKWMEKDAFCLNKFDSEVYNYFGDTIRVDSGPAVWTFIQAEDGRILNHNIYFLADKQSRNFNYNYTPSGLSVTQINKLFDRVDEGKIDYLVENNKVMVTGGCSNYGMEFNEKGLLMWRNFYEKDKISGKYIINYEYY